MKAAVKRLLCAAAMLVTTSAGAQTFTDTWWNPNESGWGVNITQQYASMFLTFFVYNSSGQAQWYVGAVTPSSTQANGFAAWSGAMYVSTGPYFGGPFNPALVNQQQVGTVTFSPNSVYDANLSYAINGVIVHEHLRRQGFAVIPLGGTYQGGYVIAANTCNGEVGGHGQITMALDTDQVGPGFGNIGSTITFDTFSACVLSGTYTQEGSMFAVANEAACGTITSSGPVQVNYTALERTSTGIGGAITLDGPNCAIGVLFSAVLL
jgi:hypothetical protein